MRKFFGILILLIFTVLVFTTTKGFAENQSDFWGTTTVKASHILVDSKESAQIIKRKIDNGESFELIAKKYSKCPSGENGGDLGYFKRGQMVKEFEDAAFSLPIGTVSQPVKTEFGWHLIKVYDKK